MASSSPLRPANREPIPIDARAADHLRYIRETMERAAEFTAVPGWGGVAMGLTAIAASVAASRQNSPRAWLTVWLIEAFVGTAIVTGGAFSVRVVPVMGLCLMAVGGIALFAPANWGDALMAAGFGVGQMGFGFWIARHHGG